MPRFGKSDEERAAEAAQRQAEEAARQQAAAHEQWLASPVGQAVTARNAGAGFFEIQLQVGVSQRGVGWGMEDYSKQTTTATHVGVLSAIEAEGWSLEHVGYFFMTTGESSADRFLGTGQNIAVSGVTMGVYLFRRAVAGTSAT